MTPNLPPKPSGLSARRVMLLGTTILILLIEEKLDCAGIDIADRLGGGDGLESMYAGQPSVQVRAPVRYQDGREGFIETEIRNRVRPLTVSRPS